MFNRAEVVDEQFRLRVKSGDLPATRNPHSIKSIGLPAADAVDIFESQLLSRLLDLETRRLKELNQSYYTIGSSGHEGNAVVGYVTKLKDMGFLHYRSGALMIQRAKQLDGSTPIYDMLLSFVASSEDPISGGRHKVFGSDALNIPPQTSTIASHLPKAVGAALSVRRALDMDIERRLLSDAIIFCNFGDASANHSTAQGAINTAQWISYRGLPMPLIFICEDNGIGISVKTPPNWIEERFSNLPGIRYMKADGLDIRDSYDTLKRAYQYVETRRKPVFLHMRTVRLMGHAGSDMESTYHSMFDIAQTESHDPLLYSARIMIEEGLLTSVDIRDMYHRLTDQIRRVSDEVVTRPKLTSAQEVMAPILPPVKKTMKRSPEYHRKDLFGRNFKQLEKPKNLSQSINAALFDILNEQRNVVVFGQDIARKGGVYNVTNGLQKRFGGKRVFDTLLDEQAILGTGIGLAHNGILPIAEIQFLAYYHNAEDQIRGEAATLSFFSNGQFTNPMVIRIASFAYQRGFGGHFHNDNSIAAILDLPGVVVACPSNGADGARMLRRCVQMAQEEGRIIFFLEPIALYMTMNLLDNDEGWATVYPDPDEVDEYLSVHVEGDSDQLVILSYGNGFYLSRQVQEYLKKDGINISVVDLKWLAPMPFDAILKAIEGIPNVLIVDECRKSGSPSEALITGLVERMDTLPKIKRVTGDDSFIPLGTAWEYVLPNVDRITTAVKSMLEDT